MVIVVTIGNVVGGVLGGGEDADVVRALSVGISQGAANLAVWAAATWMIGGMILKTEKIEVNRE